MEQEGFNTTKEKEQEALIQANNFTFLGNGPKATGDAMGWRMTPGLYFKCILCGYLMSSDPLKDDDCFCGTLSKDASWGRLASRISDEQIEVYQAIPKSRGAV